jgi:putative addiction module component (TIGR02574 family)
MTRAQLKKKVKDQIDRADERTLRMVQALLSEALQPADEAFLTSADYAELDRRVESLQAGEGKAHSWSAVKKRVLTKKPEKRNER